MPDGASDIRASLQFTYNALRYRWRVVIVPIIVVPLAVMFFGKYLGVKYKATAKALIQESVSMVPYQEAGRATWTVKKSLPIMQNVLRSRTTLERVLGRMGRIDEHTQPLARDQMVRETMGKIDIYEIGDGLVHVGVVDANPLVTYEILKLLVEEMEDAVVSPQSKSLEQASAFLGGQLEELRHSLVELEESIKQFQQSVAGGKGRKHAMTLASYLEARKELISSDKEIRTALWAKAKEESKKSKSRDELSNQMADARVKLGELTSIYTEYHPEVVGQKNKIRAIREAIRERDDLRRSRAMASSDDVEIYEEDDVITQDLLMMRDYDVKLKSYTTLLKKYEDARVAGALSMFEQDRQFVLIEEPRMPSAPISPGILVLFAAGVLLGIFLGISSAMVLEGMSGRIKNLHDAELITSATVLGVLPRLADFAPDTGK